MTRRAQYLLAAGVLAAGIGVVFTTMYPRPSPARARPEVRLEARAEERSEIGEIYLSEPAYGGNGCPLNSASVVLSPDRRKLSILFDQYVASTSPGVTLARSSCNIAVPIHVPPGLSISLLKLDYRGFASIPRRGSGVFTAEYFFTGIRGPSLRKRFEPGYKDDFLITDRVAAPLWSECGKPAIARVNSNARVEKTSPYDPDEAIITIDSTDVTTVGIVFYLDVRSC